MWLFSCYISDRNRRQASAEGYFVAHDWFLLAALSLLFREFERYFTTSEVQGKGRELPSKKYMFVWHYSKTLI
jgi:hypothetical protein